MITQEMYDLVIEPHLSKAKRGFVSKYSLQGIINCIIYRLKTGCQWRELPIKQYFDKEYPCWQTIYHHFNKWSKNNNFKYIWEEIVLKYGELFDLDVINLDGSQTLAKRGGEKVGYQRRKKGKTTNIIYLSDRNGLPISCSEPESGNHHDSYELLKSLNELWNQSINNLKRFPILNADSGFDSQVLKDFCENEKIILNVYVNVRNSKNKEIQKIKYKPIYKERFVVERLFSWLDSYKALLIRYETKASNWLQLHYLAFAIIFFKPKKIN